ncbi:MAG: transglutaminase domain-containing protein [Candidatus Hadarchaeales archaeon]
MRWPALLLLLLFPAVLAYELPFEGAPPEYGPGGGGGTGSSPWGPENTVLPPSSNEWPIPSGENEVPQGSPAVLFTVEPTSPVLFMKIDTADYYTGTEWQKTTAGPRVEPEAESAPYTLQVELETAGGEISLPVPSSTSKVFNFLTNPVTSFELLRDEFAGTFRLRTKTPATIRYSTSFHPFPSPQMLEMVGWEDLEGAPAEIREKCLQLPLSLPEEVREVAENLRNPSLGPYRQAMRVVEYLKTGFTYGPLTRTIERDAAWTYLQARQGHCFHANTTLAVLLRCLGIPARMVFGYHPTQQVENKLLYTPPGHAQVEAYFPPYGWVYFDATPPGEGPTHLPLEYPPNTYNPPPEEEEPKPKLEFWISPENGRRGENVSFTVRLTWQGFPLAGREVRILDTSTWRGLTTLLTRVEPATATYTFPRTERVGTRYLSATFREGSLEADNILPFLLYSETGLSLHLSRSKVSKGEHLELRGQLLDDLGEGVGGKTITLLLDGQPAGSTATDNRGNYRLSLPTQDLAPGRHSVQTCFDPPPSWGYMPSKSTNHTFEVVEEISEEFPWRMMLLAPAVALPLLLIFRRKKKEEAPLPSTSMRKMLEEFSSAKRYKDGIIAAYHQFLGMLMGAGLYEVRVNQTAREVASELARKFEGFPREDFEAFVKVYEKCMFSQKEPTQAEFASALEGLCSTIDKMKWG